jgi:hypothetical protein
MKKSVFLIAMAALSIAACNRHDHKPSLNLNANADSLAGRSADVAVSVHDSTKAISIKSLVNLYLQMKNALAEDNSGDAATAGSALVDSFHNFKLASFADNQKKTFNDIAETAVENAEHIGRNSGNIAHQREHFEMLSQDIYDLVKAFGDRQVLYDFFCPMVNNGKGASWLSETKEIKNPYMGKSMPTCGTLKEEIK